MDNYIPVDVVDLPRCWKVHIMPGGNKTPKEAIEFLQQKCFDEQIFGMGWGDDSDGSAANYAKLQYNEKMREGDLVIVRLYNAKYFIGKVKGERLSNLFSQGFTYEFQITEKKQIETKSASLNWGYRVEKWIEIGTEKDVPGCIVGRFSQRWQKTIQPIDNIQICMFIKQLYDEVIRYKLIINESNFTQTLDANALEDLVYLYIKDKEGEFVLSPSSCKINRMKYEFVLFSQYDADKRITCQVKNRDEIDVSKYILNDDFVKIYLFSALWDDETIKKHMEDYKTVKHLEFIKRSDLYAFLQMLINNPDYCAWKEYLFPRKFYRFGECRHMDEINSKSFYPEWDTIISKRW